MPALPQANKAPMAFIYPTRRGLFASDFLVKEGERARAVVSDPELARATRVLFDYLRRNRATRYDLAKLTPLFRSILQDHGIRAELVYLPAQGMTETTDRILLKRVMK